MLLSLVQGISGVPPIPEGYNPATWMLEATTPSIEDKIGEDFAELYEKSAQFRYFLYCHFKQHAQFWICKYSEMHLLVIYLFTLL